MNRERKLQATIAEQDLSLLFGKLCASPVDEQREEVSRAHPGEFIGKVLKATMKKVAIVEASWH